MMGCIALINKTDIMPPKHDADASFLVGLGIVLLIVVVGIYFEIRKEKRF